MDSKGSSYEDWAGSLMGRIATVIQVPHQKDFGIDFYFEPRISAGPNVETVTDLGGLQVKGGTRKLEYGGLNRRGKWQEYHFARLRSLTTPLYLARVERDFSAVELFSIWPLWWIFLKAGVPFKVVFTTGAAGTLAGWKEPRAEPHPDGKDKGDGKQWRVQLGPPFLRLTNEDLNESAFQKQAVAILRTWVAADRLILMRHLQSVPVIEGITKWTTNSLEGIERGVWQFWNVQTGVNIPRLSRTLAPGLVNLGIHLQWQNDEGAYAFLPSLAWFDEHGYLDQIGKGLIEGLRRTQDQGKKPGP